MRRKITIAAMGAIALVVGLIVWQSRLTGQADNGNDKKTEGPLPIRQVVLFNSGVGYFQREGEVDGNTRVQLTFPASDINDLLKSLVLQDLGGGRISAVSYDSHDPIEKTLRSFALDLTGNPSFGQVLNQARGEKIEVLRQEKKEGQPAKIVGTIVGMESQRQPVKDQVVEVEFLNLTGPNGLQSVPLAQVLGVRFLNPALDREFQRALQVLATSHDTQKKTVNLGFNGPGKRPVKLGYVVERPIWKTTYRLRLEANGKVFVQGWALVENPSDDDWNNVRMVLVSGRPISYKMNLYEPLYIPRPTVEPELFASLRPPVYSGALGGEADANKAKEMQEVKKMQEQILRQQNIGGGLGAVPGNLMDQLGAGANRYRTNLDQAAQNISNLAQNKLSYEELQQRRQKQQAVRDEAKKRGALIAGLNFKEGIASVATADEIGDYHRYVLDQDITLPRQKSAMLPILDQTIDGGKVSIYNERIHTKFPLLGLRLKNTSGQPLTQGPITVYENGSYAGDTRILDLQPNEERLLSYALDQGTEIKAEIKSAPSPQMNFRIGSSNLSARYVLRETKTYTIKNRSLHERTVILEHPIRPSWKLINPMKASEKTRDMYRFQVAVPAGKLITFEVAEEQAKLDQFALVTGREVKPYYAIGLGLEVQQVNQIGAEKLAELKIAKGLLYPRYKVRETTAYYVQNLSEQDRTITVDHVIRPEWVRLGQGEEEQRGPAVFRFNLEVKAGKTANKEIQEEKTHLAKPQSIKDASERQLRQFLASPVPSAELKAALAKFLVMKAKLEEAQHQLDEVKGQLKTLGEDQTRLRENLRIIPPTADPYKQFLQKFVTQEGEIENLQKQVRQSQATMQSRQKEFQAFISTLNVE